MGALNQIPRHDKAATVPVEQGTGKMSHQLLIQLESCPGPTVGLNRTKANGWEPTIGNSKTQVESGTDFIVRERLNMYGKTSGANGIVVRFIANCWNCLDG